MMYSCTWSPLEHSYDLWHLEPICTLYSRVLISLIGCFDPPKRKQDLVAIATERKWDPKPIQFKWRNLNMSNVFQQSSKSSKDVISLHSFFVWVIKMWIRAHWRFSVVWRLCSVIIRKQRQWPEPLRRGNGGAESEVWLSLNRNATLVLGDLPQSYTIKYD